MNPLLEMSPEKVLGLLRIDRSAYDRMLCAPHLDDAHEGFAVAFHNSSIQHTQVEPWRGRIRGTTITYKHVAEWVRIEWEKHNNRPLTIPQVARELGVPETSVARWIKAGHLQPTGELKTKKRTYRVFAASTVAAFKRDVMPSLLRKKIRLRIDPKFLIGAPSDCDGRDSSGKS
mgnify:CR=1 FL=1